MALLLLKWNNTGGGLQPDILVFQNNTPSIHIGKHILLIDIWNTYYIIFHPYAEFSFIEKIITNTVL